MNKKVTRKCIICLTPFLINEGHKSRSRKNSITTRMKTSHTCSKSCSKIYIRICKKIYSRKNKPCTNKIDILN